MVGCDVEQRSRLVVAQPAQQVGEVAQGDPQVGSVAVAGEVVDHLAVAAQRVVDPTGGGQRGDRAWSTSPA